MGEHRCPGSSLQAKEVANMVGVMMSDNYVGYIRRSIAQPADLAEYASRPTLEASIDQGQFAVSKQKYITAP